MRPLRLSKALQHRCAPLQAPPLVRRRQVLILHLQKDHKIRLPEKNKDSDTYHLLRWPVLRLHVLLDAAAAALDARPADVCEHWRLISTARWLDQ